MARLRRQWRLAVGITRNLGEVYGVFGIVHPRKIFAPARLRLQQGLDRQLWGPHRARRPHHQDRAAEVAKDWPWTRKSCKRARKYTNAQMTGGVRRVPRHRSRHSAGRPQLFNQHTWATPVLDVGTDFREYLALARPVKTGALEGAQIPTPSFPFLTPPLKADNVAAVDVLATAVKGAVAQHLLPIFVTPLERNLIDKDISVVEPLIAGAMPQIKGLNGA